MKEVMKKKNIISLGLLLIAAFCAFWFGYTNFFENSSLFSMIENFSYWFFKEQSNFTAYFPAIILTLLPIGLLFAFLEKIKNEKFSRIICILFAALLEYVIIIKLTVSDGILLDFILSCFSGFLFILKK